MIVRIWAWIKAWFVIVDPIFPDRPSLGYLIPREELAGELHLTCNAEAVSQSIREDPRHQVWVAAVAAVPLPRWWRLRCWWRSRPVRPVAFTLDACFDAVPRIIDCDTVTSVCGEFDESISKDGS